METAGLKQNFNNALLAMSDLILPRVCVVCGCHLLVRERFLCLPCKADLPFTRFEKSHHNPMADKYNDSLNRIVPGMVQPYQYAIALLYYSHDNPYSNIPQRLKYMGDIPEGRYFSRLLGQRIAQAGHLKGIDLVIPVPLNRWRKFKRGYNQAAVIAKEIASCIGANYLADALVRQRRTKTQTRLSAEQRAKNVRGAFRINSKAAGKLMAARHILLVDDVFTTGSTLGECHKSLREIVPTSVRISIATLSCVGG